MSLSQLAVGVCDTSPLIFLSKIERIFIVFQLYPKVVIPPAVSSEIFESRRKPENILRHLVEDDKILRRAPAKEMLQRVPHEFGRGEREAIALALELSQSLLITDDAQARKFARNHGLPLTGTIGILLEAYQRQIVPPTVHDIDRLVEAGLWMHENFYNRIIQVVEDIKTANQ